ncbi:hypothetical protein [Oenococcus sp.]|uniref:hypothetical protein n=1 Tax=Oenococcus sp. TaxID=1979414 RepID=UPI0039ED6429
MSYQRYLRKVQQTVKKVGDNFLSEEQLPISHDKLNLLESKGLIAISMSQVPDSSECFFRIEITDTGRTYREDKKEATQQQMKTMMASAIISIVVSVITTVILRYFIK